MHHEIQKKINELHAALKAHAPKEVVSFTLFLNCEETRCEMSCRSPEQLKNGGISMRNISGDFIKA